MKVSVALQPRGTRQGHDCSCSVGVDSDYRECRVCAHVCNLERRLVRGQLGNGAMGVSVLRVVRRPPVVRWWCWRLGVCKFEASSTVHVSVDPTNTTQCTGIVSVLAALGSVFAAAEAAGCMRENVMSVAVVYRKIRLPRRHGPGSE